MDPAITSEVLANMRKFSNRSHFFTLCVSSVARQLDHRSLSGMHKVFAQMDTNGDGVLELGEVRNGFEQIFGPDSDQVREVEEMFKRLDLDGSGCIDYTEFCASGLGEHDTMQENVLWTAFRSFDVLDDDGRITAEELKQVLTNSDIKKMLSPESCASAADEILRECDENGDGSIDFNEFVKVMRRHQYDGPEVRLPHEGVTRIEALSQAYQALDRSRSQDMILSRSKSSNVAVVTQPSVSQHFHRLAVNSCGGCTNGVTKGSVDCSIL